MQAMSPPAVDTAKLVQRVLGGDRLAINTLLTHYAPQLRRMVAARMDSRLRARMDPSDVVQNVLAEAVQEMVSFHQPPEQFYPWLRRLAWDEMARLHRDHIRTLKRSILREGGGAPAGPDDESVLQLAERFAAQQIGPGSRLVRKEVRERVRDAIQDLPEQDREVLLLRFIEQLNISETADALGISEAAVKSRQFRAIERLGRLLCDLREEE
jgi:RNA polymerase sigma-70 factor (ECF subfamily)